MDLFDRFMDLRTNVQKEQLQLLGVTCLFIAAKIEVGLLGSCCHGTVFMWWCCCFVCRKFTRQRQLSLHM